MEKYLLEILLEIRKRSLSEERLTEILNIIKNIDSWDQSLIVFDILSIQRVDEKLLESIKSIIPTISERNEWLELAMRPNMYLNGEDNLNRLKEESLFVIKDEVLYFYGHIRNEGVQLGLDLDFPIYTSSPKYKNKRKYYTNITNISSIFIGPCEILIRVFNPELCKLDCRKI